MDDSPGEKCEPVIVFECMDLSIGQRVNVSGLLPKAVYITLMHLISVPLRHR